jgi:hypothetical protein
MKKGFESRDDGDVPRKIEAYHGKAETKMDL